MKIADALRGCGNKPSNLGTEWTPERKEKHREITKKQWEDRKAQKGEA